MVDALELDDAFLAALIERFSQSPSISFNSHCVTESTLYDLIGDVFVQFPRSNLSKSRVIGWLSRLNLLVPILVDEYPDRPTRSTKFFRFDPARTQQSEPSPFELLQAYDSKGVLCYFSAVAFHALTTQAPAHHHTAIPSEPPVKKQTITPKVLPKARSKSDTLGTWLYTYRGLRHYKTSRVARLIPGTQTRFLGPTALIRITTLEQTLLDTLHRPLSCGGPSVVMEAWEQGLGRTDEAKLAKLLQQMDYLPIAQRLGYILHNLGHAPGVELERVLGEFLKRIDPVNPSMHQQLFPGLNYDRLHQPWMVYGPA